MEDKGNISDYRNKLDKTLASPDLTNDEKLHALVNNQLLRSSHFQFEGYTENVVERRIKEVSNMLSMLRSASTNDVERSKSSGWKVKHDTEEFRVMYREGPEGTPFHTLLAEGYVDGPLDVCLCISWESGLYEKWWPQTAVPTFKVVSSQCLQRVGTSEQISLIKMKLSWPLSSREALIHYFVFEYFQDDLMVVLLNSISDSEAIDRSSHGFTGDRRIPDAEDVVRIDVVGGFALQKVTEERSFFRTIANMDIKLDFIPPALMNFISRQLIGSGFKLYKKEVASVSRGDEKFLEALKKNPLYTRIREALYSENISTGSPDIENLKRSTSTILEEHSREALFEDNNDEENNRCDDLATDTGRKELNEFEEEEEGSESLDNNNTMIASNYLNNLMTEKIGADKGEQPPGTTKEITENFASENNKSVGISPKVEQALETLEKAISMFREYYKGQHDNSNKNLEKDAVEKSMTIEADEMSIEDGSCAELLKIGSKEATPRNSLVDSHASRHKGSGSYIRETNQSKITPACSSPDEDRSITKHIVLDDSNSLNHKTSSMKITDDHRLGSSDVNNITTGDRVTKKKKKKSRSCCLHFISG